jgi:hypothetical protein
MAETLHQPHHRPDTMTGWNGYYETTQDSKEEYQLFVVIDDGGQPTLLPETELDAKGLGHIVTTATIPPQRGAPQQESIPVKREDNNRNETPQAFTPDSSIYLG